MEVSKRICAISQQVSFDKMADIGCDHGYISIYTSQIKDMQKIIACDVNKEPLQCCKDNIIKYSLEKKIETRLSNGIKEIKNSEVDTIVVAGMGGNLIIEILNNEIDKTGSFKQLVLQPQSSIPKVRKFVHKIGFTIENEEIVFEDGFYYFILSCANGGKENYTDFEYFFGKTNIDKRNNLLFDFANEELNKLKELKCKILHNVKNKDDIINKMSEIDSKILFSEKLLEMKY